MKCPVCLKEGKRSRVYPGATITTAMGVGRYYDEDGDYVQDDPNTSTTSYQCSNDHSWSQSTCRNETTVNIHEG